MIMNHHLILKPTLMPKHKIADPMGSFKSDEDLEKFLSSNLTEVLKQSIRATVNIMVKREMEIFRKDFDDKLSFNGYYQRHMTSPMGRITDIPIPRFREKGMAELPTMRSLTVFDTERERLQHMVAEMHRTGMSTRKIDRFMRSMLGIKVPKGNVSRIHKELAEEESLQINSKQLNDDYEYLMIDGVWNKCKVFGLSDNNDAVLLCALGIRKDGTRTIIAFTVAETESYESWIELIKSIKERGLIGKNLKLIISDDSTGLESALKQMYPSIEVQNCITHKMRNVITKTSSRNKEELSKDLKAIYNSETKESAINMMQAFAKKWYIQEEQAVKSLRFHFEKTLIYYNFPKDTWSKIRTTNMLEREFRDHTQSMWTSHRAWQS